MIYSTSNLEVTLQYLGAVALAERVPDNVNKSANKVIYINV